MLLRRRPRGTARLSDYRSRLSGRRTSRCWWERQDCALRRAVEDHVWCSEHVRGALGGYGEVRISRSGAATVAFAGLYLQSRFTINPDKIYRIAMRKVNTSAGILEVMGAPLSGTGIRAYVMSSGRPRLKNFKLRFGGKRCFLIFPIRGSERRGLVSVEAKKKKGQYNLKLLAVDIPMATGPDQRIFLIGDETEYKVGGGLISELRDPIVKAMAAEKEFEDLDLQEEEEDE